MSVRAAEPLYIFRCDLPCGIKSSRVPFLGALVGTVAVRTVRALEPVQRSCPVSDQQIEPVAARHLAFV